MRQQEAGQLVLHTFDSTTVANVSNPNRAALQLMNADVALCQLN